VVAAYAPGVTNRADKPSRTLKTRTDWTIWRDVLEEAWHRMGLRPTIDALADDHNHHLPLLDLLSIAKGVRNKRNGAGLAPATTAAHKPSMWNDPPNLGEIEGRQSSRRDRGAPVAVGLLVAHPRPNETRPTRHHLGEFLKK